MNTTETVATWPELQAGQVRWLGEWQDHDENMSFRFFVARHALGAAFAADLVVFGDGNWSFAAAPWMPGPIAVSGKAPDRAAGKTEAERRLFEMLKVTP